MIENPDHWAPRYAETGAASITFHLEAARDAMKLSREIRRLGSQVAIAIKPGTSVQELSGLLTEIDMVLIMTVEPGFGGQKLIPQTISKVAEIRSLISSSNLNLAVQVDGGVTEDNIGLLAEKGATSFVAGSAVFNFENRALQIERLRQLASH
jgi:ribulose-phosphate 3-epimerase